MSQAIEEEFRALPRRQVILTMGGVMMGLFLASLDQTIVGTALPRIVADLGGFELYAWVATAYMVASTVIVPIVGRLTDMYGRKWFYVAGLIIFMVGSLLCGLSQTMTQIIAFRGLQGIGAGVMLRSSIIEAEDAAFKIQKVAHPPPPAKAPPPAARPPPAQRPPTRPPPGFHIQPQ